MALPFQPPIETMEAKTSERWPVAKGSGFAYEPKWDGFRSVTWSSPEPRIDSRNQRPLLRYFPELRPAIDQLPPDTVVDGEIVVVSDDTTSFDLLQLRVHPAESRITRLSAEIPAQFVAFDLLALEGEDLRNAPFSERRERLVDLFESLEPPWNLTPSTRDEDVARRWFDVYESAGCDGIIVKDLDLAYKHGKRAMTKIKHRRTVDCVVGGYREHKDGGMIGSLLLGLYDDDGELAFIGHCSGFSDQDRGEIFRQFESLRSEDSFGEDVRTPGADSRWSAGKDLSWTPVTPGVVVEVSYDQLEGSRFRHATRFHRWRPDKDARDCTFDQLELPSGPGFTEVVDPATQG
jgi:ATP-dependent DNA ligase